MARLDRPQPIGETVDNTRVADAKIEASLFAPAPAAAPAQEPKYVINSGLYQQRLSAGSSPRYLSVKENGVGQLIIHLNNLEAFFIGSKKVVIEITWTVDEEKAETTFTLNGGTPQQSYRALLNGNHLQRVTRFRIKDFQEESLILQRINDGEVFHWERTYQ